MDKTQKPINHKLEPLLNSAITLSDPRLNIPHSSCRQSDIRYCLMIYTPYMLGFCGNVKASAYLEDLDVDGSKKLTKQTMYV
jgi:hypothetical protein